MNFIARLRVPFIAALAVFITVLITTPSALAVEGGGIGGRPANPDPNNARTQSIFIYQLKAAESKTDEVLIMNNTDTEQVITLYAVDGILTNSGAYACEQEVEPRDSVGAWVKLGQAQVTLAADTSVKVPFTVNVPERADVGEHNGCLVFQSASDEGEIQGNVRIRTRQAIRMAVTVPGDLKKEIAIKSFTVDTVKTTQHYLLAVSNKGNVSSDIDISVRLKSFWGTEVYQNSGGYPVLADTDLDISYVNEEPPFWGGWYVASAQVTYDTRAGTFGVTDDAFKRTVESEPIIVFTAPNPIAVFMYLILLLGAGVVLFFVKERRRENKVLATWEAIKAKRSDTVLGLATKYGVDWRLIARANKLQSPYVINEGDMIKVPKSTEAPEVPANPPKKKTKKKD